MLVSNYPQKLPEYLFYSLALDKDKTIESHRMLSTKTGEYLGEMITYPQDFNYFNLATPGVRSLYIEYLETFKRNKGLGTKFLNFAKLISKQKGCNGRLHLISSDCYDAKNPPHIFYRKYGFNSSDTQKLNEVDVAISHSNNNFTFDNIKMFFPAKPPIEENLPQTKSLWKKLKLFLHKIKF